VPVSRQRLVPVVVLTAVLSHCGSGSVPPGLPTGVAITMAPRFSSPPHTALTSRPVVGAASCCGSAWL